MTPQDAALLASLIRHTDAPWKVEGTPGIDGLYDVWTALGERVCGRVPPIYTALIATAPDLHRIATEQAVEIERLRAGLETIKSASKHYAKGDCDLSYAHQSTHNLAAATLEAGQ